MSRIVVNFLILHFIYTSDGSPLGERPRSSEIKYGYLTHYIPAQWGKDSEMSYHWPKGEVPYFFDSSSYDDMLMDKVRMSMAALERDSCIRFKEQTAKPATTGSSWLHFTNKNKQRQCFHTPSYSASGEIQVILGYDCLKQGEIMHSVLHGIGFRDEVTHPQRDLFVKILWGNIRPENKILFRTQSVDRPAGLLEYDPKSIMHFHDHAFSINGQATINPLLPGLKITPSDHLSHLDKMKLGIMFGHECNRRKVSEVLDTCQGLFSGGKTSDSESLNNANRGNVSENSIKNVVVIGGHDESEKTDLANDGDCRDNQCENRTNDPSSVKIDPPNKISDNQSENVQDDPDAEEVDVVSDNQGENVQDSPDVKDAVVVSDNQSGNDQNDPDAEDADEGKDEQQNNNSANEGRGSDIEGENIIDDPDKKDTDIDKSDKQQKGSDSENNVKNVVLIAGHDEKEKIGSSNEQGGINNIGVLDNPDKEDTDVDKSKQEGGSENENTIKNVVVIAGHDESEKTGPVNAGDGSDTNQQENDKEIDRDTKNLVDASGNAKLVREADVKDSDDNRIENSNEETEGSLEDLNNSKQSNSENANVLTVSDSGSQIESSPTETQSDDSESNDRVDMINDDTNIKINSEINEDYKLRVLDDSQTGIQDQEQNLSQGTESKSADKNKDTGHYLSANTNDSSNNIDDNNDKVENVLIVGGGRRNDANNTKNTVSN